MRSSAKNLALILINLVVAVVLVEGTMRLFGWAHMYLQEQGNRIEQTNQRDVVILCIGESTTAQGGKDSWPKQLEQILNSIQRQKIFHVINQGLTGRNTDHILEKLPEYLDSYKPHYVLAMVGINDRFENIGNIDNNTIPDNSSLRLYFENFRTYKLMKWIASGIHNRLKKINGTQLAVQSNITQSLDQDEPVRNSTNLRERYSPHTRQNLNSMVAITHEKGAHFTFVGYAASSIEFLRSLIKHEVSYISNYQIFQSSLKTHNYSSLFRDDFAGHFGHATRFGNRILAENVATQLLSLIQSKHD